MAADRSLSTEELNHLASLGHLVASAAPEHRLAAIIAVVDHIGHYRVKAFWDEIATALGVTVNELREWRSQAASVAKIRRLSLPPTRPSVTSPSDATVLLIVTGHPNAQPDQTNDFTTETATIRDRCDIRFTVKEVAGIALNKVTRAIEDHKPDILHVAAHSDYGDIFLTASADPVPITRSLFADAITRARWRPTLIVLNFCHSIDIAQRLTVGGHATISWAGKIFDCQAREFAQVFYGELVRGCSLGTAFDDAQITVSRWPDLLKPRITGARSLYFT